ncbi:MAG: hypothetical protein JSS76_01400 [Bacteroidetes bacterium]|nr:hypothetical protein [Bacteroidota bacterium]
MKTILVICSCFLMLAGISACNRCNAPHYYVCQSGSKLNKYYFNQGSYWIYRDSISGEIDSQFVLTASRHDHAEVGSMYTYTGSQCPTYGDEFTMTVRSSYGGTGYAQTYTISNNSECCYCIYSSPTIRAQYGKAMYTYTMSGVNADTIYGFVVSGNPFAVTYRSRSDGQDVLGNDLRSEIYYTDSIGVVKHIDRDTAFGTHVWELQSYHVINP